jgi:hypothetical protein
LLRMLLLGSRFWGLLILLSMLLLGSHLGHRRSLLILLGIRLRVLLLPFVTVTLHSRSSSGTRWDVCRGFWAMISCH